MEDFQRLLGHWEIDEHAIVLEPLDEFNGGLIGVTEDKKHLVYSYQKLVDSLAKSYMENHNKENKDEKLSIEDFIDEAAEWIDYNTLRSMPYMNKEYVPIIIYEF